MGFGDTAKKLKKLSKTAEKLYAKMNQLVEQLQDLRGRVENTSDQIEAMDRELAEQRAIVEALAREQGIDVDAVVAEVEAAADEADGESDGTEGTDPDSGEGADADSTPSADASDAATDGSTSTEIPVEDGSDSS